MLCNFNDTKVSFELAHTTTLEIGSARSTLLEGLADDIPALSDHCTSRRRIGPSHFVALPQVGAGAD